MGPNDGLVRELAPRALAIVARGAVDFGAAEDAVQEALLAAHRQWPSAGLPDQPLGWLVTVARRRLVDAARSESSRREREAAYAEDRTREDPEAAAGEATGHTDDTLALLFLCAHPALTPASAIALTLRAVGGLTTGEIAAAFLVPETTMAQRITRAKQRIRDDGLRMTMPGPDDLALRLGQVQSVLYLIFNEGYVASSGDSLQRPDLAAEAIRIARMLRAHLPSAPEVAGLLALMLLTDSRRTARQGPRGELIPLRDQDRTTWDADQIREGIALVTRALTAGPAGPYAVQAAIGAVHAEATTVEETDWPQIVALYDVLHRLQPDPMVALNRVVAVAMVEGPEEGLRQVDALAVDASRLSGHRVAAVRGHLLELSGARDEAIGEYEAAARATASRPERDYLTTQAARLRESRNL
ncbi:RNA polymerase sigma factor [Nocardioides salsibiostraticola]